MTQLLESLETETGGQPRHAVIWLHGLGADGHDFEPIVPELVARDWPPLRFVFPHAPVRPITVNGGMRMRGWYDIGGVDIAQKQDGPGIRASIAAIERLIARENARGIPSERILLAGFSQGGAIALATGLRRREPLLGLVALSTYLPLHESFPAELATESLSVPIFMGHGRLDPVVPESLGATSRDWLRGWGCSVDWRSYPMPHSVCAEEVRDLRAWMQTRLTNPVA
ncbi:MAG: carboxylesterase [Xanthomonadales bacterium]|nr:carboxylesterase [Xanthomonadales bacterium]MCE7930347.1 carboxylesterase [Xanthomonadales bacterium PRO6]